MNPNGGKSHLTPITQRCLLFTSAGSGGNFTFATAAAPPALRAGAANAHVATAAAASAASTVAIARRFIQPLLLR
jgi:hypothetical protein